VNHLPILAFLFIGLLACRSDEQKPGQEAFKPTGTLADLVHNPVRPDGTIDSSFLPVMTFPEAVFDFGEVLEGDKVTHLFSFTNTGTAPLLINEAKSSCGCTVPEWPRQPIPPDSTGTITVTFNTAGKPGSQSKQVTIFANTFPNEHKLTVRGIVKPVK
jgi:hypothetical protein